jgi:hypothetical protein
MDTPGEATPVIPSGAICTHAHRIRRKRAGPFGPLLMQLTEKQRAAIVAWAKKSPEVEAVILSGSRYMGTAKREANVDLALVMTKHGFTGQQRALNYLHNFETWEAELGAALGLKAHLISFDPVLGSEVQAPVAKGSIELWRRE